MNSLALRLATPDAGHALLDSGDGEKLERFGPVVLARPEPQAMWPRRDEALWQTATARYEGADEDRPGRWHGQTDPFDVTIGKATMVCRLTANWHVGLFPEQRPHWDAARDAIAGLPRPRVLNLFGYTGAASLILAAEGAEVTHVDASKKAIAWGKECQAASGLNDAPIRWICDDASKFAAREVRRGRTYHAVLLDPPKFGRGPKSEVWSLFESLPPLLTDVAALLAPDARLVILTAYAIRASALAIGRTLAQTLPPGAIEMGELALEDSSGGRLPTSMYAEWQP
ncbi:MAG: class I SAM-dependent methyltransferase [Pseudomonadota bacterium]